MGAHWSSSLQEQFKLCSIAAGQSVTVDPSFSDYIWSSEAMTTGRRVLIPTYEMSAKKTIEQIKCFNANVQTWIVIVWVDQVQGALMSQLQRHSSCLHRLDEGAKVSLRQGWWRWRNPLHWWSSHPHWHLHWQCWCCTQTSMVSEVRLPTSRAQGQELRHHSRHLCELKSWSTVSLWVQFVIVHGHSGDPLHEEVDRLL